MNPDQFEPPKPRALSDSELQEVLDRAKAEGGGILAAMQILEAQAQLRETDKSELRAWQVANLTSEEEEATALDEAAASSEQPTELPEPRAVALPEPQVVEPAELPVVEPAELPVVEVVVQTKRNARDPSSSQFWVWLTISGSLLPLGIALWLRSLGLTFAQSLTAAIIGMFTSAGVVAVGAIAGKRSSMPTLVLSRAAFGVSGNLAPSVLLVLSRLFWSVVLVILGYVLIAQGLTDSSAILATETSTSWIPVAALVVLVASAVLLSAFGGRILRWAQRISGVLGTLTALSIVSVRFSSSG